MDKVQKPSNSQQSSSVLGYNAMQSIPEELWEPQFLSSSESLLPETEIKRTKRVIMAALTIT
jgi:hypothetical protein